MSRTDICWTPAAIQYATQIDVGGMEVDDPYADAVFQAIHRPLPVRRGRGDSTSSATEQDVLHAFTGEITSNEPLLLFITGQVGTGKSHLVRWLKSQIGTPPKWHIVYVEKRNTSLKRVIERILGGIDTPKSQQLQRALDEASSTITTDEEAMEALLMRLDQLVKFENSAEIKTLPGLDESELKDLRTKADRLLGDFTFRKALCQAGGPIERIVRLARGGNDPEDTVNENDLHLREEDFRVDPSYFHDTGQELQNLVARVVANTPFRTEIAALCDAYLPQAKAEIFTGQTTDLLDVFQDVRREIASRGQELCLFIEDLVLLHGIDKQLAQVLTVPASRDLCKLRAAIAVTEGYLKSVGVDTFTDRGTHFTLDIDTAAIGAEGLRDFISHYLNAGRLNESVLRGLAAGAETPNACSKCSFRKECHETFGVSESGYGLYPFNVHAVDRLVSHASPEGFQPRRLLREVIRAPLEVAEYEIPTPGTFPSSDFGKTLDETRKDLPFEVRAKIRRENPASAEAEISLRAFYAAAPLEDDAELVKTATDFGVELTQGISADVDESESDWIPIPSPRARSVDEVERWANGDRLGSGPANKIRRYICESVVAELRNGPYGLAIRSPRSREWKIGSHTLRITDVDIERSQGGGGTPHGAATFVIRATDEDAVLARGILAADESGRLDAVERGRWYFDFHRRIGEFAASIATLACTTSESGLDDALLVLSVLRHISTNPGRTVADALPAMLWPTVPPDLNPLVRRFYDDTRSLREEALLVVRDARTAAKGTGKPSVVDVGPMYATIRKGLPLKQLETIPDDDDDTTRLLKSLATKQSHASAQIWSDIRVLVDGVQRSLAITEELGTILRNVDKLVEEGHRRGVLPRSNTRDEYQELRSHVDAEMMSEFGEFAAILEAGATAANLWDAVQDPRPTMTALANYASFTKTLLAELEAKLAAPAAASSGDPAALIKELRELADEFDALTGTLG